jgi:hypothetical protein
LEGDEDFNFNELLEEVHMSVLYVLRRGLIFLASAFMGSLVIMPRAAAQTSTSGSSQEHVSVVAHLPLDRMHVNQMFVQRHDGKFYLYLHRPSKQTFAVVDITDPGKPALVIRDAVRETPGSVVQPPAAGSVLAFAFTPEGGTAPAATSTLRTETVQLVDMSNPKNVETVKTFKGVTSTYSEDDRKLVYLVNEEGLWIVSHNLTRPMPLCTSGDALTPLPNCR